MWWLILIAVALAVVGYVFRERIFFQGTSKTASESKPESRSLTHDDAYDIAYRLWRTGILLFFLFLGFGLVYMEIALLSVDFPDTVRLATPRPSPEPTPEDERKVQTLQASSQTNGATNPALSPTPTPYPVIEQVLYQSVVGSPPNTWLAVYGRHFSAEAQVRLNGRPAGVRRLSPDLLSVQLPPLEAVSVGNITVDVIDGTRVSNAMLVPVTNPKVSLNVFSLHRWFDWKPWINRETQLLLIVIFAGALGSYIHLLKSFTTYIGNNDLKASWFWFYVVGPFIGAAMALVFYSVLRGGFLAGTASDEKVVNPFGVLAVGALVGMFSDKAALKLREIFETFFKADDPRTGKLRALPRIGRLNPNRILVGQNEATVTIIGERLGKVSVVRFNSTEKSVTIISDTMITFELDATDLARARVLKVSAVDPELGLSTPVSLHIIEALKIVAPDGLPEAAVNSQYKTTMTAEGGIKPYNWSVAVGAPNWLSIDAKTGQLTGQPPAAGEFHITIKVEDTHQETAEKSYTVTVK